MYMPFLVLFLLGTITGSQCFDKLNVLYSWKALEFAYPNNSVRQSAIDNGNFIPGRPVPIDVDVYTGGYNQRWTVFITVPRIQKGVPVTLGYVTDQVSWEGNPIIAPFPNWEYNKEPTQPNGHCNGIVSVFRVQVDQFDRLWVLDTGKVEEVQMCPPQLHVFDLARNTLIRQHKFSSDKYKGTSDFVTPVVDIHDPRNSDDVFVYIADVTGFGLLVYDFRRDVSWRINNNLFYPYPTAGTFHIKGATFDLMDGILGLALSPLQPNGDKILYFHALASRVENWVPTSVIKNFTLFHGNPDAMPRAFVSFPNERPTQSAAEVMDNNGVLFFGLLSQERIACWNSKRYPEYSPANFDIAVANSETLQFPSGLKIIHADAFQQQLWIMDSSFQKFMVGSLNSNEINFRIQAGFVHELVRGTKCSPYSFGF